MEKKINPTYYLENFSSILSLWTYHKNGIIGGRMRQSICPVQEGMNQIMKAHHLRVQGPVCFIKPFQGIPERDQYVNNNSHRLTKIFLFVPA